MVFLLRRFYGPHNTIGSGFDSHRAHGTKTLQPTHPLLISLRTRDLETNDAGVAPTPARRPPFCPRPECSRTALPLFLVQLFWFTINRAAYNTAPRQTTCQRYSPGAGKRMAGTDRPVSTTSRGLWNSTLNSPEKRA